MSATDGQKGQNGQYVLQIYFGLSQDTAPCCTIQAKTGETAFSVIQNAGAALGMDMSQTYSLLELRESGGQAVVLEDGDRPVEKVLLWPPTAQKPHPQHQGYYFILQRQVCDGGTQVQKSGEEECDDLCTLPTLTDDSIVEALRQRFYKRKIYTYAGGILIAVNPYKCLPGYYNPKYVKMYEKQPLGKLSPHIFAIADAAYHTMLHKHVSQCIVITGESGSGKTESTSYLIHCLTALSQQRYCSGVERTILGAGPVLEAFGNARTAKNDNSSRFGKFIQVNYLESGVVRGAVIEKYLLEKCRLVCRIQNKSNFHVFYYMLAGASKEERKELQLLQPQDYFYLKEEDFHLEDEEKLRHAYKKLHQAMEMVGFLASTKKQIFSVLAAILYIGNVTYTSTEDGQVLAVGPNDVLSTLSDLLQVKREMLVEALTKTRVSSSDETLAMPYTQNQITAARDSLAKSLYSALFDWIVLHINHALLNRRDMEESVSCLSVGILDIFGFENFEENIFEQFCINYANDKLQYYFNQHVFRHEQEEYQAEDLTWHNVDYTDNLGCIELISKTPTGLFHLLDEESNLPQAKDGTLLDRFKQQHQDSPFFVSTTKMEPTFVIQHFAGKVKYQIKDFREKNTDHMRPDMVLLLRSSKRAFIRQLVGSSPVAAFRWGILRATIHIIAIFKETGRRRAESNATKRRNRKSLGSIRKSSLAVNRLSSTSLTLDFSFDRSDEHPLDVFEDIFASYENKKSRGSRQKQLIPKNLMDVRSLKHVMGLTQHDRTAMSLLCPHQRKKPPSISAQFEASLNELLETVGKAEPFFIVCIRSNAEKKEMLFDEEFVLEQVKYTGMLETIRIRKSGYSAKYTFKEFVERFRMLLPRGAAATQEEISKLLLKMELDPTTYQIGKTKVFLKERERQRLQEMHHKEVMRNIVILQRWFRDCLITMHFRQRKDSATIIQRCWRQFTLENKSRAATVIQSAWRSSLKRAEYVGQLDDAKGMHTNRPGRQSVERRELKRQTGVEHSPGRHSPGRRESRQASGSPILLHRPMSVPLDCLVGSGHGGSTSPSSPQSGSIQDKAERCRERRSEGDRTDDSSPERQPRRDKRLEGLKNKGKSMSVDELSKITSSSSDSAPSAPEDAVRLRTKPRRKRRLAYARSGLMINFNKSKDTGYWSFPLPPISPDADGPCMKTSASAVDIRVRPRVKFITPDEPEGNRFSLQPKSIHSPSTPERTGFLNKILKKRTPRFSPTNEERGGTLPNYTPHPYRRSTAQESGRRRNPTIRISRATRGEPRNSSLEREITDTKELRDLDEFLGNQVIDLRSRANELSATENIFLTATMQFRDTIKSMYSLSKPQIAYKDLMKGYQNRVSSLSGPKQKADVQLVVNLFQSVLDGFIRGQLKLAEAEPVKSTKKTKKRRKMEKCPDGPLDHMFSTYQVNIMQSCDLCGSYIWGMEKAYMCSACKLICHKKCLSKIITDCSTRCARKDDSVPGSLHFGVHVCVLTNSVNPVPMVVEMMLMHVEMNGLYMEGIYRKSGSASRARELHQILETNPEEVNLESYPLHTIAGLIKRWLRELPDPLMTFNLYNDFLHAVELPEKSEQMRAIYQKLDELPSANFNTLERLIFHLVKVAKEEEHNRMSSNSLAIVFAPCILRSPDTDDPFLGMKDVGKTTKCVEILIAEQFRRYTEKMQNIQQLEYAEALAINQLKLRRQNTIVEKPSKLDVPRHMDSPDNVTETLIQRIKSIKQEKEDLAFRLPELEQDQSDNDNLDSASSMSSESLLDDRLGSLDSEGKVNVRLRTQKPDCPSKPPDLAQRVTSRMGQLDAERAWTTSESSLDVTQSPSINPDQDSPSSAFTHSSPTNKPQLTSKSFDGSFDDLDIPFIDDDV